MNYYLFSFSSLKIILFCFMVKISFVLSLLQTLISIYLLLLLSCLALQASLASSFHHAINYTWSISFWILSMAFIKFSFFFFVCQHWSFTLPFKWGLICFTRFLPILLHEFHNLRFVKVRVVPLELAPFCLTEVYKWTQRPFRRNLLLSGH